MSFEDLGKPSRPIKIVAVGDEGSGKRSLLYTFANGHFEEGSPSLESNTVNSEISGQTITFSLWTVPGHVMYKHMREDTYKDTDVFLVCYSFAIRNSLNHVGSNWLPEIKKFDPLARFVLVGNMEDMLEKLQKEGSIDKKSIPKLEEEAAKLTKKFGGYNHLTCSASTGLNVKNVFENAVKAANEEIKKKGNCDIM